MNRLSEFLDRLHNHNFDAAALMPTANLKYLTGLSFHPGKRLNLTLIHNATPSVILPALEIPGIRDHAKNLNLYPWPDEEGPHTALVNALEPFNSTIKIGIENVSMRVMELRALETAAAKRGLTLKTEDITSLISDMRMVKDADEQANMAEAARRVEIALETTVSQITEGMTEQQLARIISDEILSAAEGESFDSFAAFGPNTANPHHLPGDRPLQKGDLIIIDCGATHNGYASDITRTFALGDPGDKKREIYNTVLKANEAGKTAVKPNATGEEIDRATRKVITDAGYGEYFIHRTGHGLGLDTHPCHEAPDLMEGCTQPFAAGTTFTIEPGIYIEGLGGVRIEDDVVITEDGYQSFTTFNRDLMIL
ncbi:MAG: aminopeptidase P family protein [Candidatus Latescibacteria bacterium]|jgi:Xaa-Pro aminopeptidase|nr:aminopeptidase P family protein [Candidatus Latescibacterota bacterium]